jgi:Xaa-Pro aminopeptidase
MYKGDFGRTIPVSGHFSHDQREIMELLNGAYLLGVGAVRPGHP